MTTSGPNCPTQGARTANWQVPSCLAAHDLSHVFRKTLRDKNEWMNLRAMATQRDPVQWLKYLPCFFLPSWFLSGVSQKKGPSRTPKCWPWPVLYERKGKWWREKERETDIICEIQSIQLLRAHRHGFQEMTTPWKANERWTENPEWQPSETRWKAPTRLGQIWN